MSHSVFFQKLFWVPGWVLKARSFLHRPLPGPGGQAGGEGSGSCLGKANGRGGCGLGGRVKAAQKRDLEEASEGG